MIYLYSYTERRNRLAFIPDSNMINPAQIYIAKETQSQGISPLWTPHIFSSKMVPKL